jgi:hypothetical protein
MADAAPGDEHRTHSVGEGGGIGCDLDVIYIGP